MKFLIGIAVVILGLFVGWWLIWTPLEPMHWWTLPRIAAGLLAGTGLVVIGWGYGDD